MAEYNKEELKEMHLTDSNKIRMAALILLTLASCGPYHHTVRQLPTQAAEKRHMNTDSTVTVAAGKHYARGWLHTLLYGEHYRDVWAAPVTVRVLDLGREKGGLRPVKQGGSRQTLNLWVEDPEGRQYVLRSLDKEPASGLPQWLQQSYVAHIIRDATSATHPYAALTIPPMASALGIYYTNPKLVYVPHESRLGDYYMAFAGMVALLERRPDDDQTDAPRFGRSDDVKSTRSMLNDRLRDNDTRVDARFFLRSRLFDMLLGDWSRHEGNWRWAQLQRPGWALTYRAVPRDRDNVFYRLNDALIPKLFMATKFKEHFRTFRSRVTNVEALNRSGRNLDELLLSELTQEEWLQEATVVQRELTDEVIRQAFGRLSDTVYQLSAEWIMAKLISRREELPQVALRYYRSLSREVEIVGTDKHEEFVLEFTGEGGLRVRTFKVFKDGKRDKLLYNRVLSGEETRRVHIYGLGGDDRFVVSGQPAVPMKVVLYGGAGEDSYSVQGDAGRRGALRVQDSSYRNAYDVPKGVKVKKEDNPQAQSLDANGRLLRYYLD